MPIGYPLPDGVRDEFGNMPKIAPPPGLLLEGCETPKGSFSFQAETPSTAAPTPSTNAASLPNTPLLAGGKDASSLNLPLAGLFPEFPVDTSHWNYNPFLQADPSADLLSSALTTPADGTPPLPSGWVADATVAAAAAAALWNQGGGGFAVPMPCDDTTPPGSVAGAYPAKSAPWTWDARPKLRDLRALPSRGLGLHYNHGQFGVVSLPDARPPTGPAATVVRPAEKLGLVPRQLPEVSWAVKDWVATRTMRNPNDEAWIVTETVPLAKTVEASQEEWERRFCQREKQVMVGKGTRGYQQYVQMIPKEKRTARDPSTPRVAEQCSKRAFDGRLKQWRILLHAFSPRVSPDNSPRTSTRESTEGGIEEKPTPEIPKAFLPKVWDGKNAKARVALERAAVPKHLAHELETVFCNERDGVQQFFGRPEFEFELAKRAHAFLNAEKAATFGPALHAVSSLLEELRKTNNSYLA